MADDTPIIAFGVALVGLSMIYAQDSGDSWGALFVWLSGMSFALSLSARAAVAKLETELRLSRGG